MSVVSLGQSGSEGPRVVEFVLHAADSCCQPATRTGFRSLILHAVGESGADGVVLAARCGEPDGHS